MQNLRLLSILGSTKTGSSNSKLVNHVEQLSLKLKGFKCNWDNFDLATLPYFNPDMELSPSTDKSGKDDVFQFREKISKADAILISTPEYVFSLPGVLKNALEWLVSTTLLTDKPMCLITAAASGIKAKEVLELIIQTLGGRFNEHTSILIQGVSGKIKPDGSITDPAINKILVDMLKAWTELIPSA